MFYEEMVLTAHLILKNDLLAQEAAQEAFVQLWRLRKSIDKSKSIRAYLKKSTVNRSLNILKSRKLHMGQGPEPLNLLKSNIADPESLTNQKELSLVIKKSIDRLPMKCRQVFLLVKVDGMSYKEVAENLSISPKTVDNHISKALKLMREHLKPYLKNGTFEFYDNPNRENQK